MKLQSFKIDGMDCAEEVALLKRALVPLVLDESRLNFDVLRGKLTVDLGADLSVVAVQEAVARTGLKARPWHDGRESPKLPVWRRPREVLCATSGVLIVTAFLARIWESGQAPVGGHASSWLSTTILVFAIAAGLLPLLPKAWYSLRTLRPDIHLLVVMASVGALVLGEWFEAAIVAALFSLALLMETWSVGRARNAISALMNLAPETARVQHRHGDEIHVTEMPVETVQVGSTVLVRPGERIPLDGTVAHGTTYVNQAPITGESVPVHKSVGDTVFAGTINQESAFEFRSTKPSDESSLARILVMVEEAQSRRAPSEQWVERFARVYTPIMMGVAVLIALISPFLLGWTWTQSVYSALVMLLIACPCALVISTPVTVVAGLTAAARSGVLIKGGAYLEAPARLRALALDKTGTLTRGKPAVQRIVPLNGHTESELLSRAASIESASNHPLATAIVAHANELGVPFEPVKSYRSIEGKGAEAIVDGRPYWIGSHRLLLEMGHNNETANRHAESMEDAGHSVVMLGCEEHVCGLISVADGLRPESRGAISSLKALGIQQVVMLTGDNESTARALAREVGIDEFRAELLPEDKVACVRELAARFGNVGMVGDGVNDAPAMGASNLAIAMGAAGTDVALEVADIALMSDELQRLPWLVRHSQKTLRILKQNAVIALGCKAVIFGLAMMGTATLWMAVVADMGSSLVVIFNGLRMLRSHEG